MAVAVWYGDFVSCLGFIVLSRVSVYNVHSIRYDTSYCHIFNFNVPILSTRPSIHFSFLFIHQPCITVILPAHFHVCCFLLLFVCMLLLVQD